MKPKTLVLISQQFVGGSSVLSTLDNDNEWKSVLLYKILVCNTISVIDFFTYLVIRHPDLRTSCCIWLHAESEHTTFKYHYYVNIFPLLGDQHVVFFFELSNVIPPLCWNAVNVNKNNQERRKEIS